MPAGTDTERPERTTMQAMLLALCVALVVPLSAVVFWRVTPAWWPDWVVFLAFGVALAVAVARRKAHVALGLAIGATATAVMLLALYGGLSGIERI